MKIALVTPLRNEINNIDKLFDAISNQSYSIFSWVILENGSTDGSIDKLENMVCPHNVVNLKVFNLTESSINYELGSNYARINNYGFTFLKNQNYYDELDFIGILDSDIFLEKDYYTKLISAFSFDLKLGISSGIICNLNGEIEKTGNNWVRGGCRLWRKSCFDQAGYIIGPSADSLSTAKAICENWKVYPVVSAIAYSRPVGVRVNYRYYGEASYYRGCNPIYITLKCIYQLISFKFSASLGLFIGFWSSLFANKDKVLDKKVLLYYRFYPLSRIYISFKNRKN